jgi:F-type H+-transporting ATPase subunit c
MAGPWAAALSQQTTNISTKPTATMTSLLPFLLAAIDGKIHVALAALGAGIGIGLLGMKAAEATGRNPGASGAVLTNSIIFAALIEGIVFIAIFLA